MILIPKKRENERTSEVTALENELNLACFIAFDCYCIVCVCFVIYCFVIQMIAHVSVCTGEVHSFT